MISIIFFIIASLDLSYLFHLDALLLVLVGTIGYALANTHHKIVFANTSDGAVYFCWTAVLIAAIIIASNRFMDNKLEGLGPAVSMMLHPLL